MALIRNFDNRSAGLSKYWVDEILRVEIHTLESKWAESIAVGSINFVEATKDLRVRASGSVPYNSISDTENVNLSHENTHFWNDSI